MKARHAVLVFAMTLSGCSGDLPPWKPPAEIRIVLEPGQQVICTNSMAFLGIPLANKLTGVLGWERHTFECHLKETR